MWTTVKRIYLREKGVYTMKEIMDVVIIGAGPAGLSAALYAGRARLKAMFIEKGFQGGQMLTTENIDNYIGVRAIAGLDLAMNMYEHTSQFGIAPQIEEVTELKLAGDIKEVITTEDIYYAHAVVLAMGAIPRPIGAKYEEKFKGRGISYCAICDGNFFRDKVVAVAGGGDKAIEDALYLERLAKKVYLIHRKGELRAAKILQEQLKQSTVQMIWNHEIKEVYGTDQLEGLVLHDRQSKKNKELDIDGLFVAVGSMPASQVVKGQLALDKEGYILADEDCATSIPGVFVAGDIRNKTVRQVLTATADGAIAIYGVEKHLGEQKG